MQAAILVRCPGRHDARHDFWCAPRPELAVSAWLPVHRRSSRGIRRRGDSHAGTHGQTAVVARGHRARKILATGRTSALIDCVRETARSCRIHRLGGAQRGARRGRTPSGPGQKTGGTVSTEAGPSRCTQSSIIGQLATQCGISASDRLRDGPSPHDPDRDVPGGHGPTGGLPTRDLPCPHVASPRRYDRASDRGALRIGASSKPEAPGNKLAHNMVDTSFDRRSGRHDGDGKPDDRRRDGGSARHIRSAPRPAMPAAPSPPGSSPRVSVTSWRPPQGLQRRPLW